MEPCRGAGAIGKTTRTRDASNRGDHAGGGDLSDGMIQGVRDIKVSRRIRDNAGRTVETGCRTGAVGTPRVSGPAGEGGDNASGSHLPDLVVVGIGHIDIAGGVHRYARRMIE